MSEQVPSVPPVLAALQAAHSAVQSLSQQNPSTHQVLAHSVPSVQGAPFALDPLQCPLPSQSPVPPAPQPVPALSGGFEGTPEMQTSAVQSLPSTGRSCGSSTTLVPPTPSHCTTLQSKAVCSDEGAAVPSGVSLSPHWFALHVALWHAVPCGHCGAPVHSTHTPLPSHTRPPFCAQGDASGWFGCTTTPPAQVSSVHSLPSSAGKSVSRATGAGTPLPSHSSSWQSPAIWLASGSAVPASVFATPHCPPAEHVRAWQKVLAPQSGGWLQPMQCPALSQCRVPPPPQGGLPCLAGLVGTPAVQTSSVQSLPSTGLSVSSTTSMLLPAPSQVFL